MEAEVAPGGPRTDAVSLARPYGVIGLAVSLVVIIGLGVGLCALVLMLAVGLAALALGWSATMTRVASLVAAMKGDSASATLIALCGSILVYASVAATVLAAARLRGGRNWRMLIGWHPWEKRRTPRSVWIIAAAAIVYSFAANEALALFYPASKDWVSLPTSQTSIILFFIVAAISAPITEELVFRGWLYTGLRAKLALWPSLLISALLFALAHWEATHLYALVVFPIGLALGFIRDRARTLKASIAFHAFYNGMAFVLLLLGH